MGRLLSFLSENKWRYLLQRSRVRVRKGGELKAASGSRMACSRIFVESDSSLTIGKNAVIDHCTIYVKGNVTIGDNTLMEGGEYTVEGGDLEVGHHCRLSAQRIWIRFLGKARIGDYTNINQGSEVRCDESVTIGSYCQISYNVRIWDTNAHNIYPAAKRRELAEHHWPYFGRETERPKTSPVKIGDDCWIGERAAILKGTTLASEVNVGFGTLLSGQSIEKGKTVVNDQEIKII